MYDRWDKDLSQSARDFRDIVWPKIRELNWLGGGRIRIVEGSTDSQLEQDLDQLAGIDAWHIHDQTGFMRGIASRIQWAMRFDTFTIRTERQSGADTELEKRAQAIANHEQRGDLYPFVTVHGYLDRPGGQLLSLAMVRTRDLIEFAIRNPRPTRRAYDQDGYADFMPFGWDELQRNNIQIKIYA